MVRPIAFDESDDKGDKLTGQGFFRNLRDYMVMEVFHTRLTHYESMACKDEWRKPKGKSGS